METKQQIEREPYGNFPVDRAGRPYGWRPADFLPGALGYEDDDALAVRSETLTWSIITASPHGRFVALIDDLLTKKFGKVGPDSESVLFTLIADAAAIGAFIGRDRPDVQAARYPARFKKYAAKVADLAGLDLPKHTA